MIPMHQKRKRWHTNIYLAMFYLSITCWTARDTWPWATLKFLNTSHVTRLLVPPRNELDLSSGGKYMILIHVLAN